MKYFTRADHDRANGKFEQWAQLSAEFQMKADQYRQQLEPLLSRVPAGAREFFANESLHDGTLLGLRAGDDTRQAFRSLRTRIGNDRRFAVEIDALNYEETRLYTFKYDRIHRFVFDFPSSAPWYMRYQDRGSNPIDDWMYDELTAVDEVVLRHEVLFSSGTTLLVEFEQIALDVEVVEGREELPYLPDED